MNQPSSNPASPIRANPPKVPLAFRVGVVGNRTKRLTSANADAGRLADLLKMILHAVKEEVLKCHRDEAELYDETPPKVVAISQLAEGADRYFAAAALDDGYQLTAVLPFPQAEYERDFAPDKSGEPDSEQHFLDQLSKAETVFQLDGSRPSESFAFQTAGNVILNQSDLLIVVWDGDRTNLRGGTDANFAEAIKRRVPVVWIDAHAPHHWKRVTESVRQLDNVEADKRAELTESDSLSDLRRMVAHTVTLPKAAHESSPNHSHGSSLSEHPLESIRIYYKERQARYNLNFWWKLFRNFIGDCNLKRPVWKVDPYEPVGEQDSPTSQKHEIDAMAGRIKPFFCWADRLADRYADNYRSAFVMAFFFAALSVAMALGSVGIGLDPRAHDRRFIAFSVAELLSISAILIIVVRGIWGQWHRKWLDYRLLAEIIRHQQLVVHLGGLRASPSVPEHWDSYGNPGASWMGWYARALERSLGLPSVTINRSYLAECLNDLHNQLGGPAGQIGFHEVTSARSSRIEHRLHNLELGSLVLTLICCMIHIGHALEFDCLHWISGGFLTFCCGVFPAVGAALAGINHQAEFRRIAQRTHSMSKKLKQQLDKVETLQQKLDDPGTDTEQLSVQVVEVASETARIMVNEVLDWRVIFQDQPLKTT